MKYYWTQETEDAIVRYNNSTNDIERSLIYTKHIKKPIEKMCEYIINRFKFPYIDGTLKDKKADVISHLIINMDKYNPEKGASFGYFSTAAKFYLIQQNNDEYKKYKKSDSINEDIDENGDKGFFLQLEDGVDDERDNSEKLKLLIKTMVSYLEKHLDILIYKENEKKVVYAIMQLLENYGTVEKFNKKAIYLILREMSNESPTVITSVIARLRDFYKAVSDVYYTYNEIPADWVYKKNKYSKNFF